MEPFLKVTSGRMLKSRSPPPNAMGKYEIVKNLRGHLTQVFLARDGDNYVVLKGMLEEKRMEILDEQMVLQQLDHPDIVRFIE